MAYDFQVAVDCGQPHALADWWAETLGWTVEEQDEAFIRKMIAEGYATADDTASHNRRLVWATGAAIRHPDGPDGGQRKRILFQQVPEATRQSQQLRKARTRPGERWGISALASCPAWPAAFNDLLADAELAA